MHEECEGIYRLPIQTEDDLDNVRGLKLLEFVVKGGIARGARLHPVEKVCDQLR